MNKQPWQDRFAKALELFFAHRNTSGMSGEERAGFELAASVLAAVAALWLWALATIQLRGGHFWQWGAALASGLFAAFFGARAARLGVLLRRLSLRSKVLFALGSRRVALQPEAHPELAAVYGRALGVVIVARLLAELGWALERPTSGAFTIMASLALGGATLAFSLLWLIWITLEFRTSSARFTYECAIAARPTQDGAVTLVLMGPALARAAAIVPTLIASSGLRFLCVHGAKLLARNEAGDEAYELEVRLLDPRDVPWTTSGKEPASLELVVAPWFKATFALGLEFDAFRPKLPR